MSTQQKYAGENSEAFQAEKKRIQDEANAKRAAAANKRERTDIGTLKPVVQQSVGELVKDKNKSQKAKATAAKVNTGAVARGDKLTKARPGVIPGRNIERVVKQNRHSSLECGRVP